MQCTMMKHAGSHAQFEHIRRASIDIWARKDVPECIHMLELLEEKPFHATQSGLPGHVSDNQPIESLQKILRDFVGRKQHTPRKFFYTVLWKLMEHISLRVHPMTHQQPVFAVSSVIGHEAALQLQALQARLHDYTKWRTVAFRVPEQDRETYILPAFTISEASGPRKRPKRAFGLKVEMVEQSAALSYHDSLSNVNVPPPYASTDALKKALGAYNMIKRVTSDDTAGLPRTIAENMTQHGWRCNCLEFMRRVQCGHVLFGRFIDNPVSPRFWARTLLRAPWSRPKSVRKKELPGMRPKHHAAEDMHFTTYMSIDKIERRKSSTKIAPAPEKDSTRLERSPLSPNYVNHTLPKRSIGLPHASKSSALQELKKIIAALHSGGAENDGVALEGWARAIKLQSGAGGGVDEFCHEARKRGNAWQFHPWYLAHFFKLGDTKKLPQIIRSASTDPTVDSKRHKSAEKVITYFTGSHTCETPTWRTVTRMCSEASWLHNYDINPILDSVQWDLRAMGRMCSILGPALQVHELWNTKNVMNEGSDRDYRNALAMTCMGREARWYESDDIFIVWQNEAKDHWYTYHFKYDGRSYVVWRYDSMQHLQAGKHVRLSDVDKSDVQKLEGLLKFAVCEWHRTQPDNDEAAAKAKALRRAVRFDSSRWPPAQVDGTSCGVLTIYNITLAALGITISPNLYHTKTGESYLRWKLARTLIDRNKEGYDCWYVNDKDKTHVHHDALDVDNTVVVMSQ